MARQPTTLPDPAPEHNNVPVMHSEPIYESAYQAGLANATESGYLRGYRQGFLEGFLDGFKLASPAGTDASASAASLADTASSPKKTGPNAPARLRGLPCPNCHLASLSDEAECPRCGRPNTAANSNQAANIAVAGESASA